MICNIATQKIFGKFVFGKYLNSRKMHYLCDRSIVNGKTNLNQFDQKEHAGLCCAGEVFIGAYLVCNYAQSSLTAGKDAGASKASPANWQIDELQEKLVEQWATANVFIDTISETPICIDCIAKFIRK